MTLTVTRNGRWKMVGTPDEFANFIGMSSDVDPLDVMSGVASIMEGTTTKFKDHHTWWSLAGSRSDLAEIIGYPEARTVAETVDAFASMHPNVRVLS